MTSHDLKALSTCPAELSVPLRALWTLARGDWDEAHRLVQDETGSEAAWVHAHLHRVEGDDGNAAYWYSRARRPVSNSALEEEWHAMVGALLGS